MSISRLISLFVIFFRRHGRGQARWRLAACVLLVPALSSPLLAANTIVRMETSAGGFNIELFDSETPIAVNNFVSYVNRGDANNGGYMNTFIHRSEPGFVIQGGGYFCPFISPACHVKTDMEIQGEYLLARPNTRGTIAMALNSDENLEPLVDSATSEWFINLSDDNSAILGKYTVFGQVIDSGMEIVDKIAALEREPLPFSIFQAPIYYGDLVYINRVCINSDDRDAACPETEDMASGADGNGDDIPDREQPNVTTFLTSLNSVATLAADMGMRFSSITAIDKDTALSWLKKFASPSNQTLHFNNGMLRFTAVGTISADGKKTVTLHDGATTRPAYYYVYGPTADNPTPHWYDFSYDGETGAKIEGDKIVLYFVDNKRGDDDYATNNSITHTGAQAVVTSTTASSSPASGGCSITTSPKGALRAGDWMLVSLFLAMLGLARRYGRRR